MFFEKLDHGVLWPLRESRSIYKTANVLKSLSSARLLRTPVFFIFHANEQVSSINKTKETFCQTSTGFLYSCSSCLCCYKEWQSWGVCKSPVIWNCWNYLLVAENRAPKLNAVYALLKISAFYLLLCSKMAAWHLT